MQLHEQIKIIRLLRNKSQDAVATELGVTRQAYTFWESGQRELNIPTLQALSCVLDFSLHMSGEDTLIMPKVPDMYPQGLANNMLVMISKYYSQLYTVIHTDSILYEPIYINHARLFEASDDYPDDLNVIHYAKGTTSEQLLADALSSKPVTAIPLEWIRVDEDALNIYKKQYKVKNILKCEAVIAIMEDMQIARLVTIHSKETIPLKCGETYVKTSKVTYIRPMELNEGNCKYLLRFFHSIMGEVVNTVTGRDSIAQFATALLDEHYTNNATTTNLCHGGSVLQILHEVLSLSKHMWPNLDLVTRHTYTQYTWNAPTLSDAIGERIITDNDIHEAYIAPLSSSFGLDTSNKAGLTLKRVWGYDTHDNCLSTAILEHKYAPVWELSYNYYTKSHCLEQLGYKFMPTPEHSGTVLPNYDVEDRDIFINERTVGLNEKGELHVYTDGYVYEKKLYADGIFHTKKHNFVLQEPLESVEVNLQGLLIELIGILTSQTI